jgi:DNA-binding CsgD family transcriptional regulator
MVRQTHSDAYSLTQRQREVIRLQSLGLTASEIARVLSVSSNTISIHLQDAKRQLGIHRATALARFAIEHGISPIGDELTAKELRLLAKSTAKGNQTRARATR